MLELFKNQFAVKYAVVKVQSAAEAERLSAKGKAVWRDQKIKRRANYSLIEGPCNENLDNKGDIGLWYIDRSKIEDITALFGDRRTEKQNA